MGNFIDTSQAAISLDKSSINELKQVRINEVIDQIQYYQESYAGTNLLNYFQYDDIFGCLFGDSEPLFKVLASKSKNDEILAEFFEITCSIVLYCSGSFKEKFSILFKLFDFDQSNSLQKNEVTILVYSIVKCLCKIGQIQMPDIKLMDVLASDFFKKVDRDFSDTVEFQELLDWVAYNDDFNKFLLNTTGTQSIEYAKKYYNLLVNSYIDIFKNKLQDGKDKNLVPADVLKSFLQNDKEFNYNEQYFNFFWDLIYSSSVNNNQLKQKDQNLSKIKIKKSAFEQVLRAWCAFSTIDRNHINILCTADLRLLLQIYQGQDPTEWIVKQDLLEIDEDQSGYIDRLEWLNFLSCVDPKTGHHVFRANLKKLFDDFDKDGSGTLEIKEVKLLVKQLFEERFSLISDHQERFQLNLKVTETAFNIFEELNQDGNNSLNWQEFKFFIDKCMEQIPELQDLLSK